MLIVCCLRGLVLDGSSRGHLGSWVRALWRDDDSWIRALHASAARDDQIIVGLLLRSLVVNVHGLRILHRFHGLRALVRRHLFTPRDLVGIDAMDLHVLVVRQHVGVHVDDIPRGDASRGGATRHRGISRDHELAVRRLRLAARVILVRITGHLMLGLPDQLQLVMQHLALIEYGGILGRLGLQVLIGGALASGEVRHERGLPIVDRVLLQSMGRDDCGIV